MYRTKFDPVKAMVWICIGLLVIGIWTGVYFFVDWLVN